MGSKIMIIFRETGRTLRVLSYVYKLDKKELTEV